MKVANILAQLLKCTIEENENISMEDTELWDSMRHIEIIMTIEEELNISFPPQDIPTLVSLDKIVNKIMEMNN